MTAIRRSSRAARALLGALALAGLAACGGGSDGTPTPPSSYVDPNHYSPLGTDSIATPNEATSVTHGSVTVGGSAVPYTATAGHMTAKTSAGVPEASIFYVAYTADGASAATRPVTFLFNGGPGSATAWLHLGSWAPKRLVTGVPATTQTAPFPYVDNADSLIDTTDLVFVDAVGTGLSEAIAPNTNQTFWGVDQDARVVRDFIDGWLAANGRTASPLFLYGESYGTVRVPVVTLLLVQGGVHVTGVVLQSSALDYDSICSFNLPMTAGCGGTFPSYAATGAYYGLVTPAPGDETSFLAQIRQYADTVYEPLAEQWIAAGAPTHAPAGADLATLAADTGLATGWWNAQFDMDYDTYRHNVIPGQVLGVYDARISAAVGSPLDADDEPSNTLIGVPFHDAINQIVPNVLGFTNPSNYVLSSPANETWDYSHDGHPVPYVLNDLATTIALQDSIRFYFTGGYHDLITPFHQTELDIAPLNGGVHFTTHFYDGGHMTYLDDRSRPPMKADLAAFYAAALGVH